jgi:NADH-quinone oxidoreductase subunit G
MDTVTLTIDGREVTVAKGTSVLQAAIESGINVPYYCYHPGLGVDGNCRVCLVKIEKMPKLQVSCSITASDGMVVHTQTPDVVKARAGVFEFLLLNHPLDCPVCDKGGECPLQDFSYSFGPDSSRNEFPRRVFDGEGVKADVDFGPTLMLNRNRCIMCTRCIRFMREIDGDAQIGVIARGNGSEIATFEEQGVHSILSGNLMDVCPVGAITTRDYRFKSRPWDNPSAVDTICTLCEKGCNTTAWLRAKPEWAKGATLVRFTPRYNADVNQYWMCDIGRFDYHWIEGDQRLTRPIVSDAQGQQAATWNQALDRLRDVLAGADGQVRFLLSAHASHEELFVFARLGQALLGAGAQHAFDVAWTVSAKAQPPTTKFVVPPVNAPNVAGAKMLGLAGDVAGAPDLAGLKKAVGDGAVKVLYVFDPGPAGSIGDTTWIVEAKKAGRIGTLVVQGVLMTDLAAAADIVLPGAAFVEKDASFTNHQGRLQHTSRAFPAPGEALDDAAIVLKVARATGHDLGYTSGAAVRKAIGDLLPDEPGLAGIAEATFGEARAAKHWLQSSNASERVKWDTLFQDLPPVKFADMLKPKPAGDVIPLRKVE